MVTVIVVIVAAIFIYAVVTMFRKSSGSQESGSRSDPGNRQTSSGTSDPYSAPQGRPRRRYGKWVGGGLGFAFGGPIGAIIGIALGSMFDGAGSVQYNAYRETPRGDFSMSLLVLAAAVMKADQKILRSELDYVRGFFISQFGEIEGNRMVMMLREILKQDINVPDVSRQVGQYMDYSSRLQILHFLFGIASADATYHPDEVAVIEQIAGYMGVSSTDFASVKAMFVKNNSWAYDVLEINKEASNDEVKKAYRELAKKHHPDKVGHLGEDIRKAATEKFQQINAAYEEIKKERSMN